MIEQNTQQAGKHRVDVAHTEVKEHVIWST